MFLIDLSFYGQFPFSFLVHDSPPQTLEYNVNTSQKSLVYDPHFNTLISGFSSVFMDLRITCTFPLSEAAINRYSIE